MHSVDDGEVGLHSPLVVELQLFVFVIRAAYFSAAKRDCTNRPYLPTCKAKTNRKISLNYALDILMYSCRFCS